MRVLVTGGSGFIGSHIVDCLQARGLVVRVYDLNPPMFRDDIEFHQGSVLDVQSIQAALDGVHAVFHLAAVADVKDVLADPHYAESINVRGTINVLEAMRLAGTRRFIYGSTTWVYSNTDAETVDESAAIGPPSHLYTATKIAGEHYCHAYRHLYGLETTILRYGIPYGPRARRGGVIPAFVEKALCGEPLTLAGDGTQFRKFVLVEDLAEGNALALTPIAINRTYNLDGTERITIAQIADIIEGIVGPVRRCFVSSRPSDFVGKDISSQRAKDELGWEPMTCFVDGMRRYVEWFAGHVFGGQKFCHTK